VEKAFGPLAGFLINTLFWFGLCILSDAAIANAMADMLAIWVPVFSIIYVRVLFFIILFGFLAFVNVRGTKQGSQFVVTTTILKLTPLVLLVLIAFFSISTGNLIIKNWPGIKSIGETALILFFAFVGIETALNISGEIKDPQKNIPRGIFLGAAGVLVIYLLIQFVAQGVLGDQLPVYKDAPLSSLASRLIGPIGGIIILIAAVLSIFGSISGDILATPRVLFAGSQNKLLPEFLGRIHPKFATPYWSIILFSAVGAFIASSGGFKQLAVYTSSAVLIIYLAVVLAMIRLRYIKDVTEKGSFKIPGGLIIPILAIGTICWFLSHITWLEIKALSIFFAMLTVIYFINKAVRKKSRTIETVQ
jgi:basic amino acid/polyamine antiporter, APA family